MEIIIIGLAFIAGLICVILVLAGIAGAVGLISAPLVIAATMQHQNENK